MSLRLHCSFLGTPLHSYLGDINNSSFLCSDRGKRAKRAFRIRVYSEKQNDWMNQVAKLSQFLGKNAELFRKTIGARNSLEVKCVKESFARSKGLVRSLTPVWGEGLLLLRCSVFLAVISGVYLLVWYGQNSARGFVETRLLPSVSSFLSEKIQREVDFGKVRRVSPLSITLESCSIGPHSEEFSCGEVPTMKLRVHPFASLRRGKFVIDAVLTNPTVLVAQKKDFTWLGLPSSEGGLQRHISSEEGIDYRTKTRRISREEAAAQWTNNRDNAAKEAAAMGYIISEKGPSQSDDEAELKSLKSFPCMDEKMHSADEHCLETGINYDMKHAELEKAFGIKIPGSGRKFWSIMIEGPVKHAFKWNSKSNNLSIAGVSAKRRILERSAIAAFSYFQSLRQEKYGGSSERYDVSEADFFLTKSDKNSDNDCLYYVHGDEYVTAANQEEKNHTESHIQNLFVHDSRALNKVDLIRNPFLMTIYRLTVQKWPSENFPCDESVADATEANGFSLQGEDIASHVVNERGSNIPGVCGEYGDESTLSLKSNSPYLLENARKRTSSSLFGVVEKSNPEEGPTVKDSISELIYASDATPTESVEKAVPVMLDSVHFNGGTLVLLSYGDREPREMGNTHGHVKFQNHYGRVHVQLSGNCNIWRSDATSQDGGLLSTDVFVDTLEQSWHANLKIKNFFVPLFERILEIPITWSKGRATGEVHLCMSRGETFPNFHGQIDVTDLAFQTYDSPSSFLDVSASLCFRGQRVFLQNASGWFGSVPLEASGDFGIHPDEGEFHVMCQVPYVEVNALMKTFKMKPLLFPLAGSVTAVFNCQGPLDAPVFVGSGMVSRKIPYSQDAPASEAYEAMIESKEAGAVAAFDRVPFSYLSANFTFNTDNCVADLYGIRATLIDGGEIRGAGNAWICPEGEVDDSALDINFSGNLSFENVLHRYVPDHLLLVPLKLGDLSGETKLSGALLRPRFDIKWIAPKAEGSFSDARGDIVIAHDSIIVSSSSVAFDLYTKVDTSYLDQDLPLTEELTQRKAMPFVVEGVELDLRMRGFEFFSLVSSYPFDSPRPTHLKATGRIKFQGNVMKPRSNSENDIESNKQREQQFLDSGNAGLVGGIVISGLKLNQLVLAPQLAGLLTVSRDHVKLDATGRPDESLALEFAGPLPHSADENIQIGKLLSFSLQKGQLRASACFQPQHSATLEIRHLPLDELELASLRGLIQRAEIQLNLQKRRGHGLLSVIQPKFSGILGESLDVSVRWSGDVITLERSILEQSSSCYELQGEYVLPGSRVDGNKSGSFLTRAMTGHLGSVISSMGRWRIRLEVPRAEVAEILPLARLLSRSADPAVRSRSKDLFMQNLQWVGLHMENLQDFLEVIRRHSIPSNEIVLEDLNLPGLSELKGRWLGSFDASGGGNGDTLAEFDFRGDDWEWGAYKTQRVLATGSYSNDKGLRLEKMLIQKENATIHADGTILGPKTNLHFAVLNFPVGLVPTLVQVFESSAADLVHSLRQLLSPIKGILHMEGDLRGNLEKPECDVQVRLLDGAIGGIDLGRAEVVASLTSASRFLFNSKFEPVIQNGYVHIQGSVPVNFSQKTFAEELERDSDKDETAMAPSWIKEKDRTDEDGEKKTSRDGNEERWDSQLTKRLTDLNWNILDVGEVRFDADVKDGGMMLLTALSPYADWLQGNADIRLQVRGTVDQPMLDGSASFHRASISSPVLRKPLTNFGGTVHVKSNKLFISSLESRVSRRGKLFVKGNLPLRTSEGSIDDKIELKCEVLEVRAKNILSGQVDTQMQIAGSILQPTISGKIKLSHGEAYLPHDRGSGTSPFNRLSPNRSISGAATNQAVASRYFNGLLGAEPAASKMKTSQSSDESAAVKKGIEKVNFKPNMDIRLSDLKIILGPELRIVYPLILNFAVRGELELNGMAHPKSIKPKGILTFENGDVNLVATQVRLKREHLNIAKFEPEYGLDPVLDLALVGSEWQFRIQSRSSNWQDKLVVTSTRSVEQDALSPSEAARVFESQLAESILEGDGQLAFKKLATATLGTLMPRIEGKGEFGQARWRLVYAPQILSLLSVDPTVDPLKSLASNISVGTEVEVQLGKRLQATIVRQMKDSEMAMQWTLIYQLTSRLRLLLQSAPSKRLLFDYSATSQD